jgi:hypothetical protein
MRRILIVLVGAGVLAGCGRKDDEAIAADTLSRDIQLPKPDSTVALNDVPAAPTRTDTVYLPPPPAPRRSAPRVTPAPAPAPTPPPAAAPAPAPATPAADPAASRLVAGTTLEATAASSITSKTNKPGETFTARIGEAVLASNGRVVIPAGSIVTLSIVALKPAPNKAAKDGTIVLRAESVSINGVSQPLDADVTFVEHTLKSRGIGTSEAAKVGVGAAAGAILGKVVGGGTGAAVGGVVGAGAGAAVAVESADRDVVVPVGATIRLVLRTAFGA